MSIDMMFRNIEKSKRWKKATELKTTKSRALEAAIALKGVYQGKGKNVKSTEWWFYTKNDIQYLAIAGTNEWLDWVLNVILLSVKGIKFYAWFSARRIFKAIKEEGYDEKKELVIACHSKSCTTGFAIKLHHTPLARCIAFCPAPGFKKAPLMQDGRTLIFVDPDDLVPHAGDITFDNPDAPVSYLPRDKNFFDFIGRIADHSMDHIIKYLQGKEQYTIDKDVV